MRRDFVLGFIVCLMVLVLLALVIHDQIDIIVIVNFNKSIEIKSVIVTGVV